MKNLLLIIALLFLSVSFGQSSKITGALYSNNTESIPGASVMLIGTQDSILKSYAITNSIGEFSLANIKSGDYIVKASFFGFKPFERNVQVAGDGQPVDLGKIILEAKMLNEVVVEGQYIPIEIKGDTIQYDARAFETKEHDVVEDLLKQLPGVVVAEDGSIEVQGKKVEKILVDGEEFFGNDATITTKNLPAKAVEKVQVYDKQSDMAEFTGVDDGSESPTINLKLKADHKKGMFGSVEGGLGADVPYQDLVRYQSKANVHWFKDKIQFSAIAMSNNVNETGFNYSDYQNFSGGGGGRIGGSGFQSSGLPINNSSNSGYQNTHAVGLNFNYKPSKQTIFNTSLFLTDFIKSYDKTLTRETYYTDSSLVTDELVNQQSNILENKGTIHFEQKFDTTQFLNIDINGSWENTDYNNQSTVENYNGIGALGSVFNTVLDQNSFNYDLSGSANYRKKFLKAGRNTGGGISYSTSNDDQSTTLDYLTTLYLVGLSNDFLTNQSQFTKLNSNNLSANWLWSEPISKNQLIQLKYTFSNANSSRNKEVFDQTEIEIFNPGLSAIGDYTQTAHDVDFDHKVILTNLKTTVGAAYKNLTLSGKDILVNPVKFDYILPAATINWDATKQSNLRLSYKTSITAPTLDQLQPLPNNTNPSEVVLGNAALEPEYNHTVQMRFRRFSQFNFTYLFASITGNYVKDNITYSQNINEFYVKEIIPQNLGDEKSLSANVAFGTSLYPIKSKFHLSGNASVSNGLVNLNGNQDEYTSYYFQPNFSVENISKKVVSLKAGVAYTYSINNYLENESFNNTYSNFNYYGDVEFKIKDRWEIGTDLQHYFYPDFETNSQLIRWNANIGVNLLKAKTLQVYVKGVDLLNQNTGISQYYTQNIYEQSVTQTLGRYVLVGLKYSFQKMGAK